MDPFPSPSEMLTAPWASVTPVGRVVFALQVAALVAGLVPPVRRVLRGSHVFVAFTVGTPLLWILLETSLGLVLLFDFAPAPFLFHDLLWWLLKVQFAIGATLLLQTLLAWQYAANPLRSLPLMGAVFAMLALLGDAAFFLACIAPLAPH